MSVSWLKRSGIKRDDGANDEWNDTVASVPPEVEVKNDKATPVVADERGIPSVNRSGFRSRALPFSMAALVLAAIGVVWLIPGPKAVLTATKDDPKATKNERFDENRPTAVLIPSAPPAPAAPPTQAVSFTPEPPAPLATPSTPLRIVPAPDPKAAPSAAPKTATTVPPTPLELRQQSKALIVGQDDKAAPTTLSAAPSSNAGGLGPARLQPASYRGGGAGEGGGPESSAIATSTGAQGSAGGAAGAGNGAPGRDALGDALRPTLVSGTAAGRLADRTFMMTQGNLLDCSLDVAISSAVPGMTKCTLTRSVYGDDRKVVLLERGTELTGQYQGGMQQGQKRLFILWVRAKTPAGVVITLSSPGTDSLGRSGVDGFVDTHFWERFGAGLLLSVIDDVFQIASARAQNGNSGTTIVLPQNTTQTAKSAAAIAVENDVHIPPTLEKNQGEHVSIFVARDLDFRTVYALRPADAGP